MNLLIKSYLLSELFFTQLVQSEKLPGKGYVLQEATGGKLDSDDDLSIRDHHCNIAELNLQVFGKFLATVVA